METNHHASERNKKTSKNADKNNNLTRTNKIQSVGNKKLRSSLKANKSKTTTTPTPQIRNALSAKDDKTYSESKRRKRYRDRRIALIHHKIQQESEMSEINSVSLLRRYTNTNVVLFIFLYSMAVCCQGVVERYTEGVNHQPEHKYYFTNYSPVIFNVIQTIGVLLSLTVVAFFARDAHKPFFIFVGLLLCSLGSIVWSVPSFIDSSSFERIVQECSNHTSLNFYYSEVCLKDNFMIDKSTLQHQVCSDCVLKAVPVWWSLKELRFLIMCLGDFVIGAGVGLYTSLGFLYIEESGKNEKAAFIYGVILSVMGLGHFIGSFMAWGFLKYDESLSGAQDLKDHDVRAWWLGTVLLGIVFFFLAWSFLLFPKWLVEPNWVLTDRYETINAYKELIAYEKEKKKRKRHIAEKKKIANKEKLLKKKNKLLQGITNSGFDHHNNTIQDTNIVESVETRPESYVNKGFEDNSTSLEVKEGRNHSEKDSKLVTFKPVMTSTIEFDDPYDPATPSLSYTEKPKPKVSRKLGKRCSALRDIFSIPSYTLFLTAICLSSYYTTAYRPISHIFVHHNYNFTLLNSWFYTSGLCHSLAWAVGSLVGGYVICRLRMTLKNQLLLMIICIIIHCALFFFIFPLSCNPLDPVKYNDTQVDGCLSKYGCDKVQREPVCVEKDGEILTYPSPCHASCSINLNGSCGTIPFSKDLCEEECPVYGAYWVLIFLATLSYSFPAVTVVLMFLRTVDDENKTMALSTAFLVIKLMANIPGQGIFDEITMSTCAEARTNCLGETYCWKYHKDNLRYVLHGSNIVFQAGAIFFLFLLFILAINNIVAIDYQHLISIHFGDPHPDVGMVPGAHGGRHKNGVDAIRRVVSVDEGVEGVVQKENDLGIRGMDKEKTREEGEKEGAMEDRLRRHLQVVEMQLEKQSTPAGSNSDLDNDKLHSRHSNSDVSLHQDYKIPHNQMPTNLSWSDRDTLRLREDAVGDIEDGVTKKGSIEFNQPNGKLKPEHSSSEANSTTQNIDIL